MKKATSRKTAKKHAVGKVFSLESLRESLKSKTKVALIDVIVSLADEHDSVFEQFRRKMVVKAAQIPDTPENLFKRAKDLIDKGTRIDRNDPYFRKIGFGGPKLHLEPVCEVVKLLTKNKTPESLSCLQRIAAYLLEKGKHYFDETSAETAFDYEDCFETIAGAVVACKEDSESVLAWAEELYRNDINCITGDFSSIIEKGCRNKKLSTKK
ncbi:MAG: hypothetical protein FWC43_09745 [Planctomycetaceae bacterium]|nr:hypothetical protein [Planctomycetaceae bacterium]